MAKSTTDKPNGIYKGRLATDGYGNLLADQRTKIGEKTVGVVDETGEPVLDENGQQIVVSMPIYKFGEQHGFPVAYHDGSYIFVQPGEPSHNDRHHQQFVAVNGTVDESMTDDASLVNSDSTTNPHHFGIQEDDPHYDEDAPNKTRLRHDPDTIAPFATGHTEAYTS